jgi:hypothetical protein
MQSEGRGLFPANKLERSRNNCQGTNSAAPNPQPKRTGLYRPKKNPGEASISVRARLQSCRKCHQMSLGFSPCGLLFFCRLLKHKSFSTACLAPGKSPRKLIHHLVSACRRRHPDPSAVVTRKPTALLRCCSLRCPVPPPGPARISRPLYSCSWAPKQQSHSIRCFRCVAKVEPRPSPATPRDKQPGTTGRFPGGRYQRANAVR